MWVVLYLLAIIAFLLAGQSAILALFKEPQQWTFGASSEQSRKLKLALKVLLQGTLIGSIFLFPLLVHQGIGQFYGPLFPPGKAVYFLYGEVTALILMATIFGLELALGLIYFKPRYTPRKALTKSSLSALSSLTVVSVEEPFFRGIILGTLLASGIHWAFAIPLSAVLFSAAHFIRKVKTYWPAVGLAVLGLWLGVGFYKTGNLWLSMGIHSGGILGIGVHRCFLNYKDRAWLVGTQTFPIAGVISIVIMLIGSAVTWYLF